MTYEVEQKFPIRDLAAIEGRLAALGGVVGPAVEQVDAYFAHPARDFAQTDEALRIRQQGPANQLTYKGPKVDSTTKTRREIETPLAPGREAAESCRQTLLALGFRPARVVRKSRRQAKIAWEGRQAEAALDAVEGLGSFLELELQADEADLKAARDSLARLAARLELGPGERRSYLELLIEAEGGT